MHLGTLERGNLGNAIFSFPAPQVQEDAPKEFQSDADPELPARSTESGLGEGPHLAMGKGPWGKRCLLVHSSRALEQRTEGQLSCW